MRGAFPTAGAFLLCVMASGEARAQCTVSGPDSVCAGGTAELCGQEGPNEWTWTGPGGEALGTSRCITVNAPGTYTLRQFDGDNGLFWTCSRTLVAAACDTAPPPSGTSACPRTAAWWWRQCRTNDRAAAPPSARFAAVAACADARSVAVEAKQGAALCEVIEPQGRSGDARSRALRQFAALQLNLCAREQAMADARGNAVGLDAEAVLTGVPGIPDGTRLGGWAAAADDELVALGSRSLRERPVRQAYQRLRLQALTINRGRGSGGPCGATPMANEPDDEPEAMTSGAEPGAGSLVLERIAPNPSRGAVRITWSLAREADVELAVVDVAGRTVRELVRGPRAAGPGESRWDGTAADGRPLRSGAYFVRGRVGGEVVQARLVLVR